MKRSKLLFISGIIGGIYVIFPVLYLLRMLFSSDSMLVLFGGMATLIIIPFTAFLAVGVVFNWVAWSVNSRWYALIAGIMYAASIIMLPLNVFFALPEMVICFIVFAQMTSNENKDKKYI